MLAKRVGLPPLQVPLFHGTSMSAWLDEFDLVRCGVLVPVSGTALGVFQADTCLEANLCQSGWRSKPICVSASVKPTDR